MRISPWIAWCGFLLHSDVRSGACRTEEENATTPRGKRGVALIMFHQSCDLL